MAHRTFLPFALLMAATACGNRGSLELNYGPHDSALRRMASCEDLRVRYADQLIEQVVVNYYNNYAVMEGATDDLAAEDGGGSAPPTDFTTTNVQEQGVDEMDLMKSTGEHMFYLSGDALQVVDSWPADETQLLASVAIQGSPRGMFLVNGGDTAVVLTDVYSEGAYYDEETDQDIQNDAPLFENSWSHVHITVVDVSDRANPQVVRERDVQGWVTDARSIDGQVFLVTSAYIQPPQDIWQDVYDLDLAERTWDESEDELEVLRSQLRDQVSPLIRDAIDGMDISQLLPAWSADGETTQPLMDCTDIYAPNTLSPYSIMSVSRFDAASGDLAATGLLADGWNLYASQDNLYVAQSSGSWWGFEDEGVSHIHKFELSADTEPVYSGSGVVEGWTYDQFAMSEHDGHLRVVSTDFGGWWSPNDDGSDPANHVTILKDMGDTLEVTGHIGGIAPGEQIMSARLMGDKGYMVTFEQVDPLFTLDLSDPADPQVVGELKIPGFSAYMHPMGEDHLLAVGMAGLDTGELTGLAVNVFDVSDMANPVLAYTHEVAGNGWAWSEAMWDHHAFTYHRDVLTIPAFFEEWDGENWSGFSGAISFEATADGITELGRVNHRDLVDDSDCLSERFWGWGDCSWESTWWAQVRRTAYVEDNLYTISDYGVKVNDLNAPEVQHAEVLFYPASQD